MKPDLTDRERLAADLELLGILGDPSRGPLADLLFPGPPEATPGTVPDPLGKTWRRLLIAAWIRVNHTWQFRTARRMALPTRSAVSSN